MRKLFGIIILICVLFSSVTSVHARRYFDAAIGRWLIPDPALQDREPQWLAKNGYYSVSPYVYVFNNPLKFIDPNGEEVYINEQGYINQDATIFDPDDPSVYVDLGDKGLQYIGDVGGEIYVGDVFQNLLESNVGVANDIENPLTFYNLVKTGGKWDLKNNDKTIYSNESSQNATFIFNNDQMKSQDVGNYHFGVVGRAYGLSEGTLRKGAGIYQIYSGTSERKWINRKWYGDDPRDQRSMIKGFQWYTNYKKK
jgi:RHS repeat-associated protein